MKRIRFIENGNLSGGLRTILCITGAAIVYWSVKYAHSVPLMSLGLLIAAIGGYASRAHMLKIKPFDNSYKKARKSYEVKDDEQDKS